MKKIYFAGGILCLVLALVFLILFLKPFYPTRQPIVPPESSQFSSSQDSSGELSHAPYESPIDFDKQHEINSDIYAWIQIPGTVVDYPVVQHQSNDAYYLNHNVNGKRSDAGALFTERAYNATDFSDPVTIIYGHKMRSGSMFGSLQAVYSDPSKFEQFNKITIWLPDAELEYEIFAALPYDNRHILYNYDFTNSRIFLSYFQKILTTRALGANILQDYELVPEDHILILSTCLKGDNTQRYLIMAKQVN